MTIELASLLGEPGLPGAEGGWVGPLPAETARRLACDATVTRVLVTRDRHHHPDREGGDGHPGWEAGQHPASEHCGDGDPPRNPATTTRPPGWQPDSMPR